MQIWAGLGNPGPLHAMQRHNVGFMAVDAIAELHGFGPVKKQFAGWTQEGRIGPHKVLLLKPATFMNESGRSLGEALRFYKLGVDALTVFHDELDLAPGKLRVKLGGGNAGHNGLRSITAHMGNDYKRVRLGIGHPGDKALVHSYVLNDFAKSEEPWVDALCHATADNAPLLVKGDDAHFQSKVHLAMEAAGFADVKRIGERQ